MARIRTVKPEFWTDGNIVKLSPFARLLFIGTWNFALCDKGHLPDDAFALKLKVLPADDVDADALIAELVTSGRLERRTTADGRTYLHIVRLSEHQKTDGRWTPRCPYCKAETSGNTSPHGPQENSEAPGASPKLPETPASSDEPHRDSPNHTAVREGKGKEGKVKSITPPASPGPPKGATPRGTRLPEHFPVTPEMRDWAKEKTPLVGDEDHAAFLDHFRSAPGSKGVKVDWVATWRNWMRREQKTRGGQAGTARRSPAARPGPDERAAQIQALKGQTTIPGTPAVPDNVHPILRGEIA